MSKNSRARARAQEQTRIPGPLEDQEPVATVQTAATPAKAGVNPIVTAGYSLDDLRAKYTTKSGVIRFLAAKGFETKHVAVFLDVRYQHVRNVLTTQLKKPASVGVVVLGGGSNATAAAAAASPDTDSDAPAHAGEDVE